MANAVDLSPVSPPHPGFAWASVARALRHRDYRLFFAGQAVSLVGTWLTRIATSWLIYRLSSSAWMLGLVAFVGQLPTFLLSPVAGVWVDRWSRRRVLLVTQAGAMVLTGCLAAIAWSGHADPLHIVLINILHGMLTAFDAPARQAFLVELVKDRAEMANAIALNSSMANATRLLGPSLAGILIAAFGENWCFTLDAISYLAALTSLLLITPHATAIRCVRGRVMQEMREGVRYARSFAPIRDVLILLALVSLMGVPYTVLMPLLATHVYHGGADTLGFLMAASGLGALAGAVYLAGRPSVLGLGRIIRAATGVFGLGLLALSACRSVALALPLVALTGCAMMVQMASSNIVLQTLADDDKRGRLMSFYTMAFFGMSPFGSLMAGAMAEHTGAAATLACGGGSVMCGAVWFAWRWPSLRHAVVPVYTRLGILSQNVRDDV